VSCPDPVPQNAEYELGVEDYLTRQTAIFLAATKAVACLDRNAVRGFQLILIDNRADRNNDGLLCVRGSRGQEHVVFIALKVARVYGWFWLRQFRVTINAFLPAGALDPLGMLLQNATGLEEWEKLQENQPLAGVLAGDIECSVITYSGRVVVDWDEKGDIVAIRAN
jgi:hypothetical protein